MPNLPSLGSKAPDFKANTTNGPIRLSDYKGNWIVLFSHPGDFTPVCTTEFLCFAKYYDEFKKRNTELIGLSVDSNSSHLAWMYNISLLTGVEIPFPIIEDRDMRIAKLYGMISKPMSDTSTVRSVFIIDNNQILRTILYYPLTTGRNIPEILRIVDALQTSDRDNIVTPANWFPGMPVILPYPKNYKELKNRVNSCNKKYSCMDWYLCFVPDNYNDEEVSKKIDNTCSWKKEHTKNIENECNCEHEHHDYLNKALDCKQEHKTDIKDDCNHEKKHTKNTNKVHNSKQDKFKDKSCDEMNFNYDKDESCDKINSSYNKEDSSYEDFYKHNYKNYDYTSEKNTKKIAMKTLKDSKKLVRPQITDPYNPIVENANCPDINPIVAEYVLGNPTNVDAQLLDAVIFAFAEIDQSGNLFIPYPRFLNQLLALKGEKPSLKVIVAIGGWGAEGFSDAALTPTSRYNFARQVNQMINEYALDGIDIDWEYPGSSASGITSRPQDRENFTLLLTAIRDVIGDDKWLSVAGTGDRGYINSSAEIDKIAPIIDYFNLMSYDFTAGETGPNGRKHQANLFDSDLSLPGYSVDAMVRNLENAGMPSEKILLGIPFYGRLGATITRTYDELRRDYINKNGYEYRFDNTAQVPYLVKDGDFAMSYDDALSIFLKTQYVLRNCLGGVFSWTSTYDQANILARTMSIGINDPEVLREELEGIYGQF
ncbi:TPA: peroxiredoxin [Clostridioides difficile]|nr:peroxiredoxin [Clostridioides difficile]